MVLNADISKAGKYSGEFWKRFDPQVAIALCLVPDESSKVTDPGSLEGLSGTISITDEEGKTILTNMFGFNRGFCTPSGRVVFCSYIPRRYFPVGHYGFQLNIENGAPLLSAIKHQIIAFPVSEFLPMVSDFCLVVVFICLLFAFVALTLLRNFSRAWSSQVSTRDK